jgi:hypothetical protein
MSTDDAPSSSEDPNDLPTEPEALEALRRAKWQARADEVHRRITESEQQLSRRGFLRTLVAGLGLTVPVAGAAAQVTTPAPSGPMDLYLPLIGQSGTTTTPFTTTTEFTTTTPFTTTTDFTTTTTDFTTTTPFTTTTDFTTTTTDFTTTTPFTTTTDFTTTDF